MRARRTPPWTDQERLFPRPEPDPARPVVEIGDDPVAAGERPDRLHDSVSQRISAPARRGSVLLPVSGWPHDRQRARSEIDGEVCTRKAGWLVHRVALWPF